MFVLQIATNDKKIYYVGKSGVYQLASETDLNYARIYESKKRANEAIKSHKDDWKRITRNKKSLLIDFKLITDVPEQFDEVILNINDISLEFKEVKLVLV